MTRYANRVKRLRTLLADQRLDAFLVTSLIHLRYLTGFTGTNALGVVTRHGAWFLTDSRYRLQAARQVRSAQRICTPRPLLEALAEHRCLAYCRRVGFESYVLTFQQYRLLRRSFPRKVFVPTTGFLEKLLLLKEPSELVSMRAAMKISDRVFGEVVSVIHPGMREKDVAAELTYRQRLAGADGDAFDPIVASGERGSLPHARATDKTLRKGELVTLDFGCTIEGYHSDLTRTVALGRATRQARDDLSACARGTGGCHRRSARRHARQRSGRRCTAGDHRRRIRPRIFSLARAWPWTAHPRASARLFTEH